LKPEASSILFIPVLWYVNKFLFAWGVVMPLESDFQGGGVPQPPVFRSVFGLAAPRPTAALPLKVVCRLIRQMVAELVLLLGDRVLTRRDRRRAACHARQISMYVCHVALRVPQADVAFAFGRDRSTVGHACQVVEDRRDDPVFDNFVAAVERIVVAVFGTVDISGGEQRP